MIGLLLPLIAAAPHADDGSVSLTASDVAVLITLLGSILFFGGAAVLALGWAFRNGQFENFQRGAASIFGPDEPIGRPTDVFPDTLQDEADRANLRSEGD